MQSKLAAAFALSAATIGPSAATIGLSAAAVGFSAATIGAQHARDSVLVNSSALLADSVGTAVASAGALSAVCWTDAGAVNQVFVSTSDGRGLTWSPPVRVDADAAAKTTQRGDSVFVAGDSVYVVWEASGNLYFNRSTDGGATFGTPTTLDDGGGAVRDWRATVSPDPLGDHIYVAVSTAITNEDLFLTASHDAGASFSAAVGVEVVTAGDVDALAIAAEGRTVHIAWDDDRSGADTVYYQRSVDGGATFLPADLPLGDNPGVEDSQGPVQIAAASPFVAVLWNEEPTGSGNETIQVNTSVDGGATFQGAVTVGGYTPGTDDTDFGDIAIDPGTGFIIATWEDDRSGVDQAWVATSADLGQTFSETRVSTDGAEDPQLVVSDATRDHVVVVWESAGTPRRVKSALSSDYGMTWNPEVIVSDNAGFADFVTAAYNDRYGNFIHAWGARDFAVLELFAGGFRPQTMTATGFVAGQAANFSLSGFRGTHPLAFVVLSHQPGFMPLPFTTAFQDLGLDSASALVTLSFSNPLVFSTTLDASGAGSTLPFSFTPIPGVDLWAATFAFRVAPTLEIEQLTDVSRVF